MKINSNMRFFLNDEKIIVFNISIGNYLKTSKTYFFTLLEMLNNNDSIYNEINKIKNPQILKNMITLIDGLKKIDVLTDNEPVEELESVLFCITNKCNLNCLHCCMNSSIESVDCLSTEKIYEIIENLAFLSPKVIQISGGEPMLRNDLLSIISKIKITIPNCKIILNTNLTLLKKYEIKQLISNVDVIDTSIDGYNQQSTDKMRGIGTFDIVVNNIRELHNANFFNINVSMTVTKYTQNHIDQFEALCKELNVKPIIRELGITGRAKNNKKELLYSDVIKKQWDCTICKPGIRELYIAYNGNLFPCHMLADEEFCLTNLIVNPNYLTNIDYGHIEKIYENVQKKINQYHSKCNNCEIKMFCYTCYGMQLIYAKEGMLSERECQRKLEECNKRFWKN